MPDFKNQIEAILFASGKFIDIDTLMNLTGASSKRIIKDNISKLIEEYTKRASPLLIVEEKNGWKLTVREQYLDLVRKIVGDIELPKSVLETLAIVAWHAPVLQSKVVEIRHNKAYDHIAELVELGFILKEKHGRSYQLKLSNKFFTYFEVDGDKGIREVFKKTKESEIFPHNKVGSLEVYQIEEKSETPEEEKKEPEDDAKVEVYDLEDDGEEEEEREIDKTEDDFVDEYLGLKEKSVESEDMEPEEGDAIPETEKEVSAPEEEENIDTIETGLEEEKAPDTKEEENNESPDPGLIPSS